MTQLFKNKKVKIVSALVIQVFFTQQIVYADPNLVEKTQDYSRQALVCQMIAAKSYFASEGSLGTAFMDEVIHLKMALRAQALFNKGLTLAEIRGVFQTDLHFWSNGLGIQGVLLDSFLKRNQIRTDLIWQGDQGDLFIPFTHSTYGPDHWFAIHLYDPFNKPVLREDITPLLEKHAMQDGVRIGYQVVEFPGRFFDATEGLALARAEGVDASPSVGGRFKGAHELPAPERTAQIISTPPEAPTPLTLEELRIVFREIVHKAVEIATETRSRIATGIKQTQYRFIPREVIERIKEGLLVHELVTADGVTTMSDKQLAGLMLESYQKKIDPFSLIEKPEPILKASKIFVTDLGVGDGVDRRSDTVGQELLDDGIEGLKKNRRTGWRVSFAMMAGNMAKWIPSVLESALIVVVAYVSRSLLLANGFEIYPFKQIADILMSTFSVPVFLAVLQFWVFEPIIFLMEKRPVSWRLASILNLQSYKQYLEKGPIERSEWVLEKLREEAEENKDVELLEVLSSVKSFRLIKGYIYRDYVSHLPTGELFIPEYMTHSPDSLRYWILRRARGLWLLGQRSWRGNKIYYTDHLRDVGEFLLSYGDYIGTFLLVYELLVLFGEQAMRRSLFRFFRIPESPVSRKSLYIESQRPLLSFLSDNSIYTISGAKGEALQNILDGYDYTPEEFAEEFYFTVEMAEELLNELVLHIEGIHKSEKGFYYAGDGVVRQNATLKSQAEPEEKSELPDIDTAYNPAFSSFSRSPLKTFFLTGAMAFLIDQALHLFSDISIYTEHPMFFHAKVITSKFKLVFTGTTTLVMMVARLLARGTSQQTKMQINTLTGVTAGYFSSQALGFFWFDSLLEVGNKFIHFDISYVALSVFWLLWYWIIKPPKYSWEGDGLNMTSRIKLRPDVALRKSTRVDQELSGDGLTVQHIQETFAPDNGTYLPAVNLFISDADGMSDEWSQAMLQKMIVEQADKVKTRPIDRSGRTNSEHGGYEGYDDVLEETTHMSFRIRGYLDEWTKHTVVRWMDAPMGVGAALYQGKKDWGNRVDLVGVDVVDWAEEWRKKGHGYKMDGLNKEYSAIELEELLAKDYMTFKQDDMRNVKLSPGMHLITSMFGIMYLGDPLPVWKHLFNQLAPEGVLLAHLTFLMEDRYEQFLDVLKGPDVELLDSDRESHFFVTRRRGSESGDGLFGILYGIDPVFSEVLAQSETSLAFTTDFFKDRWMLMQLEIVAARLAEAESKSEILLVVPQGGVAEKDLQDIANRYHRHVTIVGRESDLIEKRISIQVEGRLVSIGFAEDSRTLGELNISIDQPGEDQMVYLLNVILAALDGDPKVKSAMRDSESILKLIQQASQNLVGPEDEVLKTAIERQIALLHSIQA